MRELCFLGEHIDQSWRIIRCDLQEILIDSHHHINHDRFVSFYLIDFDSTRKIFIVYLF